MIENLEAECVGLIRKYKRYRREYYKIRVRNELYLKMKDDLVRMVRNICHSWGKYEEETEIISLSWDVFEFGLKHYKDSGIPASAHFFTYSRYYLLNRYAKREKVHLPLEELKDILGLVPSVDNIAFNRLLTLVQMRNVIPDEFKIVFDDAVQSCCPKSNEWKTSGCSFPKSVYYALKKSFKPLIKFMVGVD